MTLEEYKKKLFIRKMEEYPGYGVSNTGKIWSYKSRKWIKPISSKGVQYFI